MSDSTPATAAGQFQRDHERDMADPEYAEAYRQATEEVTTTAAAHVSQQNARGQWVPAIPEPLFAGWRLRRCRCNCGQTFKDRVSYRGHYALVHILAVPR